MRSKECYRGYGIEAEAPEPPARRVTVKIFALGPDGVAPPDAEPMNTQTYEPEEGRSVSSLDLVSSAIELARSSIDNLLGIDADTTQPRHQLIDDARAGKSRFLMVPFVSVDPLERLEEIDRVLASDTLAGLQMSILLNHADMDGLPTPEPRPNLLGVQAASDVPAGEFHLRLTLPAEAAG
jgi:hypothetical protein